MPNYTLANRPFERQRTPWPVRRWARSFSPRRQAVSRRMGVVERERLDRCCVPGCHREPARPECRDCRGRPCPHHAQQTAAGLLCERCHDQREQARQGSMRPASLWTFHDKPTPF
jgi:hypothetical protein